MIEVIEMIEKHDTLITKDYGRIFPEVRGVDIGGGGLEVYKVSFSMILKSVDCPVEGCLAKAKPPGRLREHFIICH